MSAPAPYLPATVPSGRSKGGAWEPEAGQGVNVRTLELLREVAVATGARLLASKAMSPATTKLYELETEEAKRKKK